MFLVLIAQIYYVLIGIINNDDSFIVGRAIISVVVLPINLLIIKFSQKLDSKKFDYIYYGIFFLTVIMFDLLAHDGIRSNFERVNKKI